MVPCPFPLDPLLILNKTIFEFHMTPDMIRDRMTVRDRRTDGTNYRPTRFHKEIGKYIDLYIKKNTLLGLDLLHLNLIIQQFDFSTVACWFCISVEVGTNHCCLLVCDKIVFTTQI